MYTPTWTTSPNEGSWVFASTYLLILRYNHPNSDSLWQCSITEGCAVIFNEKNSIEIIRMYKLHRISLGVGGWGWTFMPAWKLQMYIVCYITLSETLYPSSLLFILMYLPSIPWNTNMRSRTNTCSDISPVYVNERWLN